MEPGLFKRVTGLNVKDFELLVSLGVFNGALMNDAVYKFKRYEDSSLSYTGIDKRSGENVGGYDTALTADEYQKLFGVQQGSMTAIAQAMDNVDIPDYDFDGADGDEDEEVMPEPTPAPKAKPSAKAPSPVRTVIAPNPKPTPQKITSTAPSKITEKQKVDVSGVKVGGTVKHKSFGDGTVTNIADGRILVKLAAGEKMFQFPQAFDGGGLVTKSISK